MGAPDPARWIDPLMQHLGVDYRVSLLRAAAFHGSAHQAAMVFQVIVPKQISEIEIGRQRVRFLYQAPDLFKATNRPEWLASLKTDAGYAKVAGVELTLLDMCRYFHQAGGINAAAQVVQDIGQNARSRILAEAAKSFENSVARRLGYLLERFGHERQAKALLHFAEKAKSFKPLNPAVKSLAAFETAQEKNPKWKLVINAPVETDE
ncbi:type IV toxin-antitoxin system AbiEi family antitoxin [bacterium]|nr:type IV toxin-antitoxin system AbiEi family antitoxin [bacterium]